jgi:hypothetical protein
MDIGVLTTGGYVNAAAQDTFCSGTTCTIVQIYDQSGKGNHLTVGPAGGAAGADTASNATAAKIVINNNEAYGVYEAVGNGYRRDNTSGIATGDNPEGMYAVFDGTRYNTGCCYDYGNAETDNNDDGNGTMEAIYFGNSKTWGYGAGNGPWVMADMENNLMSGVNQGYNANDATVNYSYLTAIVKGGPNLWAIKTGNAQSGSLTTQYSGVRPNVSGYNPMKKQGAIILGIGGDNSHSAIGTFFEGAMTSGYPSDATENSVQANIVAAGYGSGTTAVPTAVPTLAPTTVPIQNPIWSGGPYTLNGTSSYVDLPDGIMSGFTGFSIACWVDLNSVSAWARIFDIGTDTTSYMFLTPDADSGSIRYAISIAGNGAEEAINGTGTFATGSWQHVAVTRSGSIGILYVNGSEVGRNSSMTLGPADLGSMVNSYIGKSQFASDPYLNGSVDKFYIYNRALSASEVTTLASTKPGASTKGDVNSSGAIDIVDALVVAQYYVGLNPSNFNSAVADVNCSGSIDIVDALLIAQYYVGLISTFPC